VQVRPITASAHLAYIATRPSVSFLQTPAWGEVKREWLDESLGWFDGDELVGAGLMLLRKVPKVERYLAYLPEGPDLDWTNPGLVEAALTALTDYAKSIGVFQIKMGPHVWTKRWDSEDLKNAIAQEMATLISRVPATHTNHNGEELIKQLRKCGWRQPTAVDSGFGDYQPRYVFQLALQGQSEENLFEGFNQLWRRNIRKAEKQDVTVRQGTREDLAIFHACYVETAIRDNFTPRPLSYFERMWDAMSAEDPARIAVYIAEHEDYEGAIAATTMTRVGQHSWYSYGASTTEARDLRPSNAIQWAMMKDALEMGAGVYDMRGISDTLDAQNPLFGLIQFKLGTGGYAQEYVGEWDYVISPLWAKAFNMYMARR